MNAISNISGPIVIGWLKWAIGSLIVVEDFQWQQQEFILVSCSPDIIKLEICAGRYQWAKISLDLGTNSIVDVKIKKIKWGNTILFDESYIQSENLELAKKNKTPLSIDMVIFDLRNEYRKQISGLLQLLEHGWKMPNSLQSDASTLAMIEEIKKSYVKDGIISDDL